MIIKSLTTALQNPSQVTILKCTIKTTDDLLKLPLFAQLEQLYLTCDFSSKKDKKIKKDREDKEDNHDSKNLDLFFQQLPQFPRLRVLYLNAPTLEFLNLNFAPESLQFIDAKNCQIKKISSHSRNKVKELNLSANNLLQIPQGIGHLGRLEILNLTHNNLQTLSDEMQFLQSLKKLILNQNLFTSFPFEIIQKLNHLKIISMDENPLPQNERERIYEKFKIWFD